MLVWDALLEAQTTWSTPPALGLPWYDMTRYSYVLSCLNDDDDDENAQTVTQMYYVVI